MMLASYREKTRSSGKVEILRDVESPIADRDILLIDDILESGRTLAYAKDLLAARGAKSVQTAVLLEKPGHLAADIAADHRGFICPDKFVVGYGMDMAHQFRELPFVGHVLTAKGEAFAFLLPLAGKDKLQSYRRERGRHRQAYSPARLAFAGAA